MAPVSLNQDSYIRSLRYSHVAYLCNLLDPGSTWERFAAAIPKRVDVDEDSFEPRYTYSQIQLFAQNGLRRNCSPTRDVFNEWSTQNVRIRHLIHVLAKAELYAAADYISVNVLNGGPVSRSPSVDLVNQDRRQLAIPLGVCCDSVREQTIGSVPLKSSVSFSPESNNQACVSGFLSAQLQDGQPASNSGVSPNDPVSSKRVAEENEETFPTLDSVVLQQVRYSVLEHITNQFNPLSVTSGGRLLGKGGFGTVYLGQFHNGMKIAVKCLMDKSEDVKSQFETELQVLSRYRHENVVHLLAFSMDGPCLCLIYQYMQNGSLEDRLACRDGTPPLTVQQRISIAIGTAEGIAYLNGEGLVHRDIKSANVLLDVDFTPKVADFATTRTAPLGTGDTLMEVSKVIGTSAYLAEEAYQFDISALLDSYSYGVVLLELITGIPPYDSDRDPRDIRSYVDEYEDDINSIVDHKAGDWDLDLVETLYQMAQKFLQRKKKRPLIKNVLPDLKSLSLN